MTTNQLIENINNKIHEFGFGYILYHSLMEDIGECVKEYEKERLKVSVAEINEVNRLTHDNIIE